MARFLRGGGGLWLATVVSTASGPGALRSLPGLLLVMALCPPVTFVLLTTTAESAATRLTDRAAIAPDTTLARESVAVPGEPDASAAQAAAAADDRPVLAAAHHGGRGLWTNRRGRFSAVLEPCTPVAWLAGVFLLSGRLLLSLASILRLGRRGCRIPAELGQLAADVARRLGLWFASSVTLVLCSDSDS